MSASPPRAFGPLDPRGARARLGWAALLGTAAFCAAPGDIGGAGRFIAAWDVVAMTMLASVGFVVANSTARETRRRAAAEDPGRTFIWLLVIVACTVSLFAASIVLHQAPRLAPASRHTLIATCFVAVAASWFLAHAVFTLRYARMYYGGGPRGEGGITFAGDEPPDDFDFAYLAFTIGMCFQVSDMSVTDRSIRRTVLLHAVLSFTYNTVVLALALNLAFGHLG